MNYRRLSSSTLLVFAGAMTLTAPAWALTGVQVGASSKTYASAGVECAMNPIAGMSPMVRAGLYNPKGSTGANISLNGTPVASVTFASPDANVWLADGANTVVVALNRKTADSYTFDATPTDAQINVCIPDTSRNTEIGDLEYAASGKSYATIAPGCAWNAASGRAQHYVHLFDNGAYLLNVSVNNVPLTQLDGRTRTHTPVFLAAGLNVITAANASVSVDNYVRDGGDGTCPLP